MSAQAESRQDGGGSPTVRFEATVPGTRTRVFAAVADLALDRLPDAKGGVRLLLTPDDARRLLERGFEVHLLAAHPVAPLAKELTMSDAGANARLERQLEGARRKGG